VSSMAGCTSSDIVEEEEGKGKKCGKRGKSAECVPGRDDYGGDRGGGGGGGFLGRGRPHPGGPLEIERCHPCLSGGMEVALARALSLEARGTGGRKEAESLPYLFFLIVIFS
jgi:hypothetical protein